MPKQNLDLFQQQQAKQIEKESPLANRMRPRTLDEYVGQEHIIGKGRLLRRAIEADQLSSLIFYGPPGTGKTTLAMVIANTTRSHFVTLNAVLSGVKQLREAIADATERRQLYGQRTTLFVDEVHRWNKAQQDALLPHVERGTILLIGATTENPYFEVNKALVSRSRIFMLQSLTEDDLREIARQAIQDQARGYGNLQIEVADNALDHLVNVANGDARGVLNALELAVETTQPDEQGTIHIDLGVVEESIQRRAVLYDKDGDAHYDTISAFIKSLRGSDPDAAVYWAAKMIYAGEDARFIFRRMGIFASEDVGLADPNAVQVVESCWAMYERIGMPEGQFPLAQAVLYLATAPKSNTSFAYFDAFNVVKDEREADVPNHIRDSNRDKDGFGHGVGYKYPHAYQDHWVAQQYLPSQLQGKLFYEPSDQGYEGTLRDKVIRRREAQLAAMLEGEDEGPLEILTNSPKRRSQDAWLERTISNSAENLSHVRDKLFELARIQRHHLVLDVAARSGLLFWEAIRRAPEGGVWGIAAGDSAETLRLQAKKLPEIERPRVVKSLDGLEFAFEVDGAIEFDRIIGRNPITKLHEQKALLATLHPHLRADGRLVLAQVVPSLGQRLHDLVQWDGAALRDDVAQVEEVVWSDKDNPLVNWGEADLRNAIHQAGYEKCEIELVTLTEKRRISESLLGRWFGRKKGELGTYEQQLLTGGLPQAAVNEVAQLYRGQLANREVDWRVNIAYVTASL